ncbi:hypothetical protein PanWU01x14_044160 [Parasponia andersonii]|uniref:Uncharacterized protein n=1 Tax=Parasponia andersonii TaxID=3476 RepID=A0A2P5DP51_PARAD|nr:hypothetical protein PanWU01x14_044160 [Parasponia andersonii]
MKVCIRRSSSEDHPIESVVSIIGQLLELIGDGKVKQLRMVLQYTDEVPPGRRPRLQRRVQATELAVARAGAGDHRQGPDSEPSSTETESTGLAKQTTATPGPERGREIGGFVVRNTGVHQVFVKSPQRK